MRMRLLSMAALVSLAGCTVAPADATFALDGTAWRLTEIQSMDDAQGTTAVPEGQRYTVRFDSRVDGQGNAGFQIDCNRGSSSWQSSSGASDMSGELTFGTIAATEMSCPPGSLDQRVATALSGVRGFLIQDGRLHLSLLADSGILTWEPDR